MKSKIKNISVLLVFIMLVFSVFTISAVAKDTQSNGMPFQELWNAIDELWDAINEIELTPGPQGPQGEQGPAGPEGPPGTSSWTDGAGKVTTDVDVGIGDASPAQKLDVAGGNIEIDTNRYLGHGCTDTFSYTGGSGAHNVGWYSLGWYNDFPWGNTAYLSGYGGIKFFTGGKQPAMTIGYWGTTTIDGELTVDGKLTANGGVDPPYVSYSNETHDSIRDFAEGVEDHEEVMMFWNGYAHRMEVYVIGEDKFYTIAGVPIEE